MPATPILLLMPAAQALHDASTDIDWCLINAGSAPAPGGQATLAALCQHYPAMPCWVALPPGEASSWRVSLPTRQRQRARQALPWALEEQLADEVETLHFALGQADAARRFAAVVIAQARLAAWCDWAAPLGKALQGITPLEQLLPRPPAGMLLATPTAFWWAGSDADVTSGVCEWLEVLRPPVPGDSESSENSETPAFPCHWVGAGVPLEHLQAAYRHHPTTTHATLADAGARLLAPTASTVNLLQGDFQRQQRPALARQWRWLGVAALIAVLVHGAVLHALSLRATERAAALEAAGNAVFAQVLPDTRRVSPRVQLNRAVAQARAATQPGDVARSPLAAALAQAATALEAPTAPELTGFSYRDGRLELTLQARSIASLEQVRETLAGQAGWQVRMPAAEANEQGVRGRLLLARRAAAP